MSPVANRIGLLAALVDFSGEMLSKRQVGFFPVTLPKAFNLSSGRSGVSEDHPGASCKPHVLSRHS